MPGPPAAPRLSAPSQASKSTRSGGFTLEEIINDPEAEIKDVETARIFLDQLYTVQGEPSTPEHISHALFYISQSKGVNNTIRSAIRATAYLVRELATSEIAEAITRSVTDKIETSVVAAISPQIAKILTAADNLEKTNENAKSLNDNIARNVESITTPPANQDPHQLEGKVQELITDMGTIKSTLEDMKNQLTNQIPTTTRLTPYKDALTSTASNSNQIPLGKRLSPEYAKAHAAIKERQILIDPNSNHPALNSSSSRETVVDTIKQALEAVDQIDGPDMQLKSITQLRNNGILIELSSHEAVEWIKSPSNKEKFLATLGGEAMIKDRHYNIVIPFLPISTDTDNPDTLRDMESENNIPHGSIAQIRWIKDPAKRIPNQRVAHALASITSPETANQLLRDGFYWGLDRLRPHKDKKEPIRCLKCQRIGHLARDCKQTTDTCGICALPHRTQDCDSSTRYCVNCQNDTHTSADRSCPDFARKRNAMDDRTPENRMPYFPTSEEWTHVELPPRPTIPIAPTRPQTSQQANQNQFRQMTLGEGATIRPNPPRRGQTRLRGGRGGPLTRYFTHNNPPTLIPSQTQPLPPPTTNPQPENPTPPTAVTND